MNTNTLFETRAERGRPRGADNVLAEARREALPVTESPSMGARRWGPAAVVAASVAAVVGLGVTWLSDETANQVSTDTPLASQTGADTEGQDQAPLSSLSFVHGPGHTPRVVIDRPDFRIDEGEQSSSPGVQHPLDLGLDELPVAIYQESGGLAEGFAVLRYQTPRWEFDGASIQAHDLSNAEVVSDDDVTAVSWTQDGNELVIIGVRTSTEQLTAAASSAMIAEDGTLSLQFPPAGMELVLSERPDYADPILSAEYHYSLDGISGGLHVWSSTQVEFYGQVIDRLADTVSWAGAPLGHTDAGLFETNDGRVRSMWWAEGFTFDLRVSSAEGDKPNIDLMVDLVADIAVADDATWDRVTPDSWKSVSERDSTVDIMLEDVPLPDGFDVDWLKTVVAPGDPNQMGFTVTGQVACAWIEQRLNPANQTDRDEAGAALATARSWSTLQEMADQDGYSWYPEQIWQYADAAVSGEAIPAGTEQTVEDSYRAALTCLNQPEAPTS